MRACVCVCMSKAFSTQTYCSVFSSIQFPFIIYFSDFFFFLSLPFIILLSLAIVVFLVLFINYLLFSFLPLIHFLYHPLLFFVFLLVCLVINSALRVVDSWQDTNAEIQTSTHTHPVISSLNTPSQLYPLVSPLKLSLEVGFSFPVLVFHPLPYLYYIFSLPVSHLLPYLSFFLFFVFISNGHPKSFTLFFPLCSFL